MAKEYHNEFLHMVVDCKTGNKFADIGIENAILGYVYMTIDCLEKGKFDQLIEKSREMAEEFRDKTQQ